MSGRNVLPWMFAAGAIGVWGVTFASTRCLLADFSSLEIQLARFSMAWIALACATWRIKPDGRKTTAKDELLFAAMGLSGVAVYQFLENCAIYYTSASNVAILVSFGPIVTALLARAMAKDKSLSLPLAAGSAVSVAGVAMIALNGVAELQLRPLGDLMAVAAMVSWGFYSVLMDVANRRGVPQLAAVRKSFFWALAIMLPFAIWGTTDSGFYAMDGSFSVTVDAEINAERFTRPLNWLNLCFLGIFASAAAFVMWNKACRSIGVVRTTIGLYLTPIVGVLFAVAFLGERPTAKSVLGGLIILAGVMTANLRFRRSK